MGRAMHVSTYEAQAEYVKAVQNGYGFARHGDVAHYLFRADQLEPSVLADMPRKAPFYIWSFKGCTLASYGDSPWHAAVVFTPIDDASEWTKLCPR